MEDKLRRWQARIQAFITAWLCCDELVGSFVFGLGYCIANRLQQTPNV